MPRDKCRVVREVNFSCAKQPVRGHGHTRRRDGRPWTNPAPRCACGRARSRRVRCVRRVRWRTSLPRFRSAAGPMQNDLSMGINRPPGYRFVRPAPTSLVAASFQRWFVNCQKAPAGGYGAPRRRSTASSAPLACPARRHGRGRSSQHATVRVAGACGRPAATKPHGSSRATGPTSCSLVLRARSCLVARPRTAEAPCLPTRTAAASAPFAPVLRP